MKPDDHPKDAATAEDIRQAIARLSSVDFYRLRKAARHCLPGTCYSDPQELLNEVIDRTMTAAIGKPGRRWPTDVPFMAYLVQTMKGLASDSRESAPRRNTEYLEVMTAAGGSSEEALGGLQHAQPDAITLALELEDENERSQRAQAQLDLIDGHFAHDDQVKFIIMGRQDNLPVADVCELAGMTRTQHETAQRRLRRGLEKLFPGRRTL